MLFCMVACRPFVKDDNIELTEFTKDMINLYLNDEKNVSDRDVANEIIILSYTDDTCNYLSIFANNPKAYKYCSDDYLGQTKFMNHAVKAFGDENTLFFLLNKKVKWKRRCNPSYVEYDPNVWYICMHKDGSLCTQETYRIAPHEDITVVESLVDKYFSVSKSQ